MNTGKCPECGGPWRYEEATGFGVQTCGHEFNKVAPSIDAVLRDALAVLIADRLGRLSDNDCVNRLYEIRDRIAPPLARSHIKNV